MDDGASATDGEVGQTIVGKGDGSASGLVVKMTVGPGLLGVDLVLPQAQGQSRHTLSTASAASAARASFGAEAALVTTAAEVAMLVLGW